MAMTIAIPVATHLKFGKAANSYLPTVLSLDKIVEPGWGAKLIFLLLPQFLSFALIAWWDDLDLFYRARQPWAGLSAPNLAHLNITLDYLNCGSRTWKALMKRDYLILLLGIGSMLSFLLPLISAGLFRLEMSTKPIGTIRGEQHYFWDTTEAALVTASMHHGIPLSAVTALLRPPKTIDWITHSEAILPFELDLSMIQSTSIPGTFWQAQTKSLRSKLECRPLPNSRITWGDLEGGKARQPQEIEIVLSDGILFDDGSTSFTTKACGGTFDMDKDLIEMDLKQQKFFCSHWILRSVRTSSSPDLHPGWIIPMVMGDLHSRNPNYGPLLRPDCTATVLLCVPDAYLGTGSARIVQGVDVRHPQGSIIQHSYNRAQEEELPGQISWAFSRMLNNSIHNASTGTSTFAVPEPPIDSMTFVGDLMGYFVYRNLASHETSIWELEKPISDAYSTIFAHVIAESNWLRRNFSSNIEVTHVQWREVFRVRIWVLCLMIILVFFFASTAVPLVLRTRKKYIFPITPESLENSLFLLHQSTIVNSIKSIPHPEKLTINAFHRQVELLGHKYMFGRYRESDTHYEQFGVDRSEEFEVDQIIAEDGDQARDEQGRPAERYRDEPAESETSTSDGTDERDDRINKRRHVRARGHDHRRRGGRHREDQNDHNDAKQNQPGKRESGRKGSNAKLTPRKTARQESKQAQSERQDTESQDEDRSATVEATENETTIELDQDDFNPKSKEASSEAKTGAYTAQDHSQPFDEAREYEQGKTDHSKEQGQSADDQTKPKISPENGEGPSRSQEDDRQEDKTLVKDTNENSSTPGVAQASSSCRGQAKISRFVYRRSKPAATRGHHSTDQQNLILLEDFPSTKHLPEPHYQINESSPPPQVYTLADFPDASRLPELFRASTKDTSHMQQQDQIQDPKVQAAHETSSARNDATAVVPVPLERDGKRSEDVVSSAAKGPSTPTATVDNHNDLMHDGTKVSQQPEYDSDASFTSDIEAFINNLETEDTIARSNTDADIAATHLEQNDDHSISAGSATAFLDDQPEDKHGDRDRKKHELSMEGEDGGELNDNNNGDNNDESAKQDGHEGEGAGKDEAESANISHSQH